MLSQPHPSLSLGKLSLPSSGYYIRRTGSDARGQASSCPPLYSGEMALTLTTGDGELTVVA